MAASDLLGRLLPTPSAAAVAAGAASRWGPGLWPAAAGWARPLFSSAVVKPGKVRGRLLQPMLDSLLALASPWGSLPGCRSVAASRKPTCEVLAASEMAPSTVALCACGRLVMMSSVHALGTVTMMDAARGPPELVAGTVTPTESAQPGMQLSSLCRTASLTSLRMPWPLQGSCCPLAGSGQPAVTTMRCPSHCAR